jgi:hypothetical protein
MGYHLAAYAQLLQIHADSSVLHHGKNIEQRPIIQDRR